jgi:hypothetical protein
MNKRYIIIVYNINNIDYIIIEYKYLKKREEMDINNMINNDGREEESICEESSNNEDEGE